MAGDSLADALTAADDRRGQRKEKARLDKRMPVGVQLDGTEGTVTVESETAPDDIGQWDWILDHHPGVSPDTHEVDERYPVEIGSWEMGYTVGAGDGREAKSKTLYRYRVKVRTRRPGERLTEAAVSEMVKLVRKRRPIKPATAAHEGEWLVLCLADLQLGKGDYGGTPAALERARASIDSTVAELKTRPVEGVAIVDMGDMCEGTACFYDNQSYLVDLNMTQQIQVATDLALAAVDAVLPHTEQVIYGAVPSNHGEFRVGKNTVATDRARDNIDLIIADSLARVFAANPDRYGRAEVWTPPLEHGDPYVLTLNMGGVLVGFTHGHQVSASGVGRMAKLETWWQRQTWSDGRRPAGDVLPNAADCDVLVCGHGHTFMASDATGRLLVQCPAGEDGSEYWNTATGLRSGAGVLSFRTHQGWPLRANEFVIR